MARPRKFYPVFIHGRIAQIAEGRQAALLSGYGGASFKDRLAAEEFSAWWNYKFDKDEAARDTARKERIAASRARWADQVSHTKG
mgnify:CR=1 FL=1